MLKGGNERSFAGCKGNKELALRRNAVDADGTGHSQRHPREPQKPFDAALEQQRINLRTQAADLLDLIPGCP
jgi:hypothetical protein